MVPSPAIAIEALSNCELAARLTGASCTEIDVATNHAPVGQFEDDADAFLQICKWDCRVATGTTVLLGGAVTDPTCALSGLTGGALCAGAFVLTGTATAVVFEMTSQGEPDYAEAGCKGLVRWSCGWPLRRSTSGGRDVGKGPSLLK